MRAAVVGRGFANRGEVSRTRSRIRELDSRTRSRIMIRSSSSARSVLRPPQSATAPQLGPTMLGAQPPYGVQIEFNAERLLSPRCDRAAVLVEAIASDPLAHCLGLSGRENGLAGGALQRSFQTAGGASMEPLVDRFRVDAHQRRHVLDGSTILQLRQSSEPLPPMLVALAHRAFAQVGNTLRQIIQPRLPHPTTLRPLSGCYGEDGPQPFLCSLAKAGEAAKQALEPWRAKNAHCPWQAFLQMAQQPGQEQQSAVILRPRDEVPFALGHPEVATDTCEQAIQPSRRKVVALLLRASHPDHREEHVGERHRRRPIEHANAGKDRRSTSLAADQCGLQIKGCHVCDETVSLGKARSASATDKQFCGVVQNAQPQHVPAGWARPSERHAMTGACARPAQHPDQLEMRTFGNADRTDIDAARTSNARLRHAPAVRREPIRLFIVQRRSPAAQRHINKADPADAGPAFEARQHVIIGATPPLGIEPGIDAERIPTKTHAAPCRVRRRASPPRRRAPRRPAARHASASVLDRQGAPALEPPRTGQTATRRRSEGRMKPASSIMRGEIVSTPVSTASTAARMMIAMISPNTPSAAERIRAAIADSAICDGLRSGSTASSVLSSRRYSSSSVQSGSGNGSNRLTSWSSLRIARSASAVPTPTSGICSSLPSQRSTLSSRRCCIVLPDSRLCSSSITSSRTLVARMTRTAAFCFVAIRSRALKGIPSASRIAPKNRFSSGPGGICILTTGSSAVPSSLSAAAIPGCARRNFSTIMVLPLFVGPTSKWFGIRIRFGKLSRSSSAARTAFARA